MSKTNSDLQADVESLCDQVVDLRMALVTIMELNTLGKTKELADLAEIALGYRKK